MHAIESATTALMNRTRSRATAERVRRSRIVLSARRVRAGSMDVGTHPAGWVPVGVGDFDDNGVADIMWQNTTNGHVDNWMLAFS